LLPHCTFDLNPRAASIDTPLHAYLPYRHVDHVHPDAVIAIAASARSEALTREIYGDAIGWLPWRRPGFELGLKLEAIARANPHQVGCVLGGHGLFTWADDGKACYQTTLRMIQQAQDWLDENNRAAAFGGPRVKALPEAERRRVVRALLPRLRGRIAASEPKVGHVDMSAEVLEFVNASRLEELAAQGTSCPDHFLRTKIRPLVVPADADDAALDRLVEAYRQDYAAFYERCRHPDSPAMRDPNAVVYLVPGVGMLTFARDKPTARIAAEFYVNAINVMRGAAGVDSYVGLAEQEAFNIEYWLLEEAKLQRLPKPRTLAGRVALVTGGAGGIGSAVARRLLAEGACVVLTDIDAEALARAEQSLAQAAGRDVVHAVVADVTDEAAVAAALGSTVERFGGIDIVVANAGLATAAAFAETSLADWEKNSAVLAKGVFLVTREAFKVMLAQKLGGSFVTIGSKNALATSAGASAYCAAKAAAVHLTRCIALEGAPHGIRANVVNPDAVLRGSKIWDGDWRKARATGMGIDESQLEEAYRQRSLLKRSVYPEDIAEAVLFLAGDAAAKSTGNILNVDAGNQVAFSR
ncbi:MAG: bifunctional rhamnulose-1-phosphate aldolase/short-chain dehydrogenase, partial [Geminicoccaceae bacterium]